MQLEFAKVHHKIAYRRKIWHGPELVELPKFVGSLQYSRNAKVCQGLSKNHTQWKMWAWPLAREAPNFLGFPYISATTEASDFKFGKPLGFAMAYYKIASKR